MTPTKEQLEKLSVDHPIFTVLERMSLVEEKMAKADPEIGTHLRVIHKTLGEYEELAHLLSPEQIGVLMKGLQKHTGIQLVMEDQAKGSRGKSKKTTVDDII